MYTSVSIEYFSSVLQFETQPTFNERAYFLRIIERKILLLNINCVWNCIEKIIQTVLKRKCTVVSFESGISYSILKNTNLNYNYKLTRF